MLDKGRHSARPLFVFYGIESEYVLGPLCREMQGRGHDCVEIFVIGGRDGEREMRALPTDRRIMLVTSVHFYHDRPGMLDYTGTDGCLSLFEVIDLLQPAATIYVPHDLSAPLLPEEMPALRKVDLYLGALESENAFARYTRVKIVGWSKYRKPAEPPAQLGRALWLFSDVETRIWISGLDATYGRLVRHMRPWCAVKFGNTDIVKPLELRLRAAGFNVIDSAETAATHAPRYHAIVSNGESSTVRETGLMGKPIYMLTDPDIAPESNMRRMFQFLDLESIHFIANMDSVPERAAPCLPRLRPFDMEAAIGAIEKEAAS
jgi:hypothetical protein